MVGELLIRWTARLAMACYAARLVCDLTGRDSRVARWWWTAGCTWFLVHVAVAFHFEHGWNHSAAFAYTAKRTAELTGWNSGVGLYINEAFLCLWITDTALWWKNIGWPNNRRAYWIVQGIFAFLAVQATAVFGPPFWKPVVAAFLGYVLLLVLRRHSAKWQSSPNDRDPVRCKDSS